MSLENQNIKNELLELAWKDIQSRLNTVDVKRPNDEWLLKFNQFKAFVKTNNCYPSNKTNKVLSTWVSNQQSNYKLGTLTITKTEILKGYGFNWTSIKELQWQKSFEDLKNHLKVYNEYPITKTNKSLSIWVSSQRKRKKKGIMRSAELQKLNAINFAWIPLVWKWDKKYEEIKEWVEKHQAFPSERTHKSFFDWIYHQRKKQEKGLLLPSQTAKIEDLKWESMLDINWEKSFKSLKKFLETFKRYPQKKEGDLSAWVIYQRRQKDNMSDYRRNQLNTIEFPWNADQHQWDTKFKTLKTWINQTQNFPTETTHVKLDSWLQWQRKKFKKGVLQQDRIEKLNSIGFDWRV